MFKVKNPMNFSIYRKPLASSYNNLKGMKNYFREGQQTANVMDLTTFISGDDLDPFFKRPGTQNDRCITISNTLYETNRVYGELLDYISNMYYWYYTVTPRKVKNTGEKISKDAYNKIYNNMLEVVDGISIETVFPLLLLHIFKNGCVNFCTNYNNNSKTINTIILPNKYCKQTFLTQYGTQEIKFDFSFFDNLALTKEEINYLLSTFPPEFEKNYYDYKNGGPRWADISGKHATCIGMNEDNFPSFLSVFYDIIDYKTYKINELERNLNQLERIVTQEIDMEKTGLELPEIAALHDDMANVVCQSKGSTALTSPGKINVLQMQEDLNKESTILSSTYKTIFDNGGFNNALFSGETDLSLQTSLNRDLQMVWSYVKKLEVFYNLSINNYKGFKDYQLSLKMLPVSPYNEKEKLTSLHQSATLGIGVLDYIVATGTKQVDLESTIELEEFLHLSNRLKPLQSSHTQSSTSNADKVDPKEEPSIDTADDVPQEEKNDKNSETER